RKRTLNFMRPFGCPVTILNTLDHLGNQTNGNASTKANIDAGQAEMTAVPGPQYVLLPFLTSESQNPKSSKDEIANDAGKKNGVEDPAKEDDINGPGSSFTTIDPERARDQRNKFESVVGQEKDANSTYRMFTPVNVAESSYENLGGLTPINNATPSNVDYPTNPLMPDLEDTANLQDTEENTEFHQIVDFLSTCLINYALTVSPTIYASYIEQFWNTATSKTVNSVKQIHVIIDGKAVVISESSVRSDLLFNDEDGLACLTNDEIFENLALIGYKQLSTKLTFQKDAQTRPETVSKMSRDPPLSEVNTSGCGEDSMEYHDDLMDFVPPTPYASPPSGGEDTSKHRRNDGKIEDLNLTDGTDTEVIVEDKGSGEKGDSTADQVSTARPKVSTTSIPVNVSVATPSTPPTTTTIFGDEDLTIAQTLKKMRSEKEKKKEKGKRSYFEEESSKKQKLEEDNDAKKEELRDSIDVVPRDDVAIDVESLATKYPIVDWKTHILNENMMYYQIIRADGNSKNYKIFSEMLDDFDRKDVIDLHRLVNERFDTTSPEGYDLLLWEDLKTLFEPNKEDEIWKNQ
ncbi:hypothetical protein Tco_1062635, partial [Tanacetum coccineum]